MSTNDDDKLTEITNKVKMEIPNKRTIQKPMRYLSPLSSSSESEEENQSKKTKIEKKVLKVR